MPTSGVRRHRILMGDVNMTEEARRVADLAHDFAHCWEILARHPRLTWLPPFWRGDTQPQYGGTPIVRAVERNLVVSVRHSPDGFRVVLDTGPLSDLVRRDGVDPLTPIMEIDPRLHVEAASFENAVCELARTVVQIYGPADPASRSTTTP